MRTSTVCKIFFLAIGCLLLPQHAWAQNTHGSASLIFDDETGILHRYSATDPDYSVQGYYNSWVVGGLLDETNDGPEGYGFTYLDVQTNIGQGRVEQATQAEAEADTQYKLESLHQVEAIYYEYLYLDPSNDPEERYIDYFNFESVEGFDYEYSHTFHGPGPSILMDAGSRVIDLGTTYDRERTGIPHHLKVITDRTITETAGGCSRAKKLIDFQIVEVNNNPVGRAAIDEEPKPYSLIDSCSNQQVFLNPCSDIGVNSNGTFTDSLSTGCPNI